MKKDTLFLACLSLLALCGMLFSGARAQETAESYPVSLYGLTAAEAAPEHPAEGWTEFQMPALGESGRDTITKTYLQPDAKPLNITNKTDVALNAIGFDFPYGGRTMTHFGLTGNGLIYLGAAAEASETPVKREIGYLSTVSKMELTDVIVAATQAYVNWSSTEPSFVADGQTHIGYYKGGEEGKHYLLVSFRDVLVEFFVKGNPNKTPPIPDSSYSFRLTYDVVLHEDGRIMCRFVDLEELPFGSGTVLLQLAYGLLGKQGEEGICMSNWDGTYAPVVYGTKMKSVTLAEATKNNVMTFTLPTPCIAPEGSEVTETVTALYSTDFTVTLTKTGMSSGFLAFVADDGQVTDRPENGKNYKTASGQRPADLIGSFPVLGNATGKNLYLNATGLKADKTHYIYVYPYNAHCIGEPFYQEEPIKIAIKTAVGGPAVETTAVTETSVTFNFPELAANTEILVGMSRRDYRDEANQRYIIDGISGKAYAQGDTLFYDPSLEESSFGNHGPYLIEAVHVGTVTGGSLTIDRLEAATPYYFYFWTALEDENAYSQEYVEKGILTTPTTPFTFTFANDRNPKMNERILPAGWQSSPTGMNVMQPFSAGKYAIIGEVSEKDSDEGRSLGVNLMTADQTADIVRADVITPAFRSSHAAFDVRYRVKYISYTGTSVTTSKLGKEDTLTVWYRVEQGDWQLAACVTEEEPWEYASDNFVTLKATVRNVPQDKDIQLRFMMQVPAPKNNKNQTFVLHHVLVEPHLNCAYPENIAVFDSLTTHGTLGLSWQDENTPASSVIYRYRLAGTETWSQPQAAQWPTRCMIRPLQANTTYEVVLQAVCRNADSSLVKTITATTLRGLPYQQALTDLTAWPAGVEAATGALPAEGAAEIKKEMDNGSGFIIKQYSEEGHTAAGVPFAILTLHEKWLKLPALCLEDMPAPAECTFQYKAYYRENGQGEPEAVDAESPFRVLVLVSEDGTFRRADSVGELRVKDMKTDYQTYTIDLSAYTRQVYVALYAENKDYDVSYDQKAKTSYFIVDSLEARYTADMPCYAVEDINQYGLTATGITLSWTGYSVEYGIMLTNEDQGVTDTVYTTETTYTLTDLEPGTLYTYRIQAYCEDGHRSPSALSEEGFFTTRDICAAPTDLKCGRVGTDYAELSWMAGKNNTYFNLMYRPSAATAFDTVPVEETAYRLSDLKSETAYVWQLQAVCGQYLVSTVVKGADFTTESVAVELTSRFAGLKVGVEKGRIAIWNADALPIDRVEVYGLTGRMLYGQDFRTTDHLWLPVLEGDAHMVLVRVFSAGETAVYKIVLL